MKTIITLFLLAFCASVQARIGETVAECVARYGKPVAVSESGLTFTFKSKGFEIEITFFNGKCEVIEYARWVPGVLTEKYSEAFSEVEQKVLLEANAGGQLWIPAGDYPYKWRTTTHDKFANSGTPFKIITYQAKLREEQKRLADDAAKKAEAEKKLKGL